MNTRFYKISTAIFILIFLQNAKLTAQEKRPIYAGLQIAVTKEKFYEKNEFDVNIIPVVLQTPVSERIDLRLTTIGTFTFGKNEFRDAGAELAAPIFLKKKESISQFSEGFYLGPIIGFGRNLPGDYYTFTPAGEAGYFFLTEKRFAFSVHAQYGRSLFIYDSGENENVSHFGVKAHLGYWF